MNNTLVFDEMESPVGRLLLVADEFALREIRFEQSRHTLPEVIATRCESSVLAAARAQLDAYFVGDRTTFDLPLNPIGTPFQLRVWRALATIPYGATCSYAKIATQIDAPTATRAVGAANGRNPLPIVVPCHRVIGANGSLTGFGGGLPIKRRLLELESKVVFRLS